jgi:hypothetical protein
MLLIAAGAVKPAGAATPNSQTAAMARLRDRINLSHSSNW